MICKLRGVFGGLLALLLACAPALAATVIRANNTTTYAAKTAWQGASPSYMTINVCPSNGATVVIDEIDISSGANPATKLQGALWLLNAPPTPTSLLADGASFVLAPADFAKVVGGSNGISFTLASQQGAAATNSGVSLTGGGLGGPLEIQCAANTTAVFVLVEVINAYVPAALEPLTVNILVEPAS